MAQRHPDPVIQPLRLVQRHRQPCRRQQAHHLPGQGRVPRRRVVQADLLTLGDPKAATLAVQVGRDRLLLLTIAVLLAAIAISIAGPIAFLGLVAPHLARKLVGGRHRVLLPAAILCGAIILQLSDIAVRSIKPPLELPAGIFTALIGAPYFFYLLRRSR